MDDVSKYAASGWRRDLAHIIGCHYATQVGTLQSRAWEEGSQRFFKIMKSKKDSKWLDIKELSPLKFMPYVADLFRKVTGRDLKGLGDYIEWMQPGGYYHWKVVQLGQVG